jgi:phospholipid/cholesterol/gamma-HCH transport system permease protein
MFQRFLSSLGGYFVLMGRVFQKPEKWAMYKKSLLKELQIHGLDSLWIVSVISIFVGAVVAIQTALNLEDPLIPDYYVAIATRESIILEFSPTMISLILAGKVGSNIASTLGTMRVTEQIEALDVMGVNSATYLVLPKVLACVIFNPLLITISMFLGLYGGFFAAGFTGMVSNADFIMGLQLDFRPYYVGYALFKTVVFAFLISSISAYYGYTVTGGAVEVGKASTNAVVSSSVAIIVANYLITDLILSGS